MPLFSLLAAAVAMTAPAPAPYEFKMSVQSYTFNRFTAFEAIEKIAKVGGKYIELYPGQKMKPGSNVEIGPGMGDAATNELLAELKKQDVTPVAFGVTGISTKENEARPLFVWAKKMGLMVINTESAEAIDMIEKMVKEFDIKVGFHDHPKRANDPSYRMWDPNYVLSLVKNRDKRIGSCADTGHWVRSGIKPVDALKILKGRIVSSHLKDLHIFDMNGHDVPYGMGVSDIEGILNEFRAQGFRGPASVEYEHNWDNSLPEVGACLGFVRGFFRK